MLSYEMSDCEMLLFCGDFNVRLGSIQDAEYSEIGPRKCIDKAVNAHGQALLSFLNDNSCCILNGRCG